MAKPFDEGITIQKPTSAAMIKRSLYDDILTLAERVKNMEEGAVYSNQQEPETDGDQNMTGEYNPSQVEAKVGVESAMKIKEEDANEENSSDEGEGAEYENEEVITKVKAPVAEKENEDEDSISAEKSDELDGKEVNKKNRVAMMKVALARAMMK
jgi:hypothetical protein